MQFRWGLNIANFFSQYKKFGAYKKVEIRASIDSLVECEKFGICEICNIGILQIGLNMLKIRY